MKNLIKLLLLFSISLNSQADNTQYSIQIAATKTANLSHFKNLSSFGSIYIENTNFGLSRIKIGSYAIRLEAENALQKIRKQGFKDAFITAYTETVSTKRLQPTTPQTIISTNQKRVAPESTTAWAKLSDDQKNNVVYLDGVLHLRNGEDFIPLSNY